MLGRHCRYRKQHAFRTRSTLLQRLRTSCEGRVGCVYYSSDRKVEFQQALAADSQMRPSSLLRYRKQAVQYIRANRGPTIYFITPPRAEDRVLSARCAADRTKTEVDQKRRRCCFCCCCYLGGLRHDALCAPLCNTGSNRSGPERRQHH